MASAPHPAPQEPATPPGQGVNRRFATGRAVLALMLREMGTRYGRSPGGYVWALLEPMGVILILSIGFSLVIRSPALGSSFILFFATGFLPFGLYQNISNNVARSINFSRALLFYPAVTWTDAVLARFLLNMLTDLLVMLILFAMILWITEARVLLDLGPIMASAALAAFLGLSVGVVNCALIGLFPIWMQVWSIITRPLFLISGIFYLFESVPQVAQDILWFNPLVHIIGLMRQGFYPTYAGDYISMTFVMTVSLVCLFMGVVLMGRYHRDILNDF
jgi:capsular polysaccharide transport system permease protein